MSFKESEQENVNGACSAMDAIAYHIQSITWTDFLTLYHNRIDSYIFLKLEVFKKNNNNQKK